MENWEAEWIEALRKAESSQDTASKRDLSVKWRLVDEALSPHRRWLFRRYATLALFLLSCAAGIVYPRRLSSDSHLAGYARPSIQPDLTTQPAETRSTVHAHREFLFKTPPRQSLPVLRQAGPDLMLASASDSLPDSCESAVSAAPLAGTSTSARGRQVRRSGVTVFIEGLDSGRIQSDKTITKPLAARRKQGGRAGWVTQIRF